MHVRWRTLSPPARASLEALMAEYAARALALAATDPRGRYTLNALVLALGHFKVRVHVVACVLDVLSLQSATPVKAYKHLPTSSLQVAFMDLSPTTRALVAEAAVTSLRALPEHLAAADVLYALGQMRAPLAACPPPLQVSAGIF